MLYPPESFGRLPLEGKILVVSSLKTYRAWLAKIIYKRRGKYICNWIS